MSQENVEVVRPWKRAMETGGNAGYAEMIDALFAADAVWIEDPRWPDATTFTGTDAIKRRVKEYNEIFGWTFEIERMLAAGDDVVLLVKAQGRGTASGAKTQMEWGHRLTFASGKIVRWRVYLDRGEALEAVGLSE